MTCILLLGKYGQLGWELHRSLITLGRVVAVDHPEIDLAKPADVRRVVQETHPEVIVNAAAYTAVDQAENEPEIAMAVNAHAPGLLAELASKIGAALIHYSTNFVFNGEKGSPYLETDPPNPLNVYGKSKLAGEQAVAANCGAFLILRTSWVYSMRGGSFVHKVLRWSQEQQTLRVVNDQIGSPTWARMLAESTAQVLAARPKQIAENVRAKKGVYHLAGSGSVSRFEWAKAILKFDPSREGQAERNIEPAKTDEFLTPARRPLYSALDCRKFENTFNLKIPPWEYTLKLAMDDRAR